MNIQLKPHRQGEPLSGTLCLPCAKNVGDPEEVAKTHPDWELIPCPVCGQDCYISPDRKETLSLNLGLTAACTECAISGAQPRRHQ